jgi:hypothetical protein
MDFWIIDLVCVIIFGTYIYKISYFYDYKYVMNVIRFVILYLIYKVILHRLISFDNDITDSYFDYFVWNFAFGLLVSVLLRTFLVNKYGEEERFANEDEMKDIGKPN